MTKYLWIPVVGTIAALIAVLIFSREREAEKTGTIQDLLTPPGAMEPGEPPAADPTPPAAFEAPDPEPKPREWSFVLHRDGSLTGASSDERYGSVAEVSELLKAEAADRPKILLGQGDGVSEQQLEEAAAVLRTHCDIRMIRRGNQETPAEEEK